MTERQIEEPVFNTWGNQPHGLSEILRRCPDVYAQGRSDCEQVNGETGILGNPYPKDSDQFFAWNRGWNSFQEIILKNS